MAGATARKSAGRQRLTDAIVRRLPLPQQGKAITVDADVPGFGARVTANGARSFILRYTTRAGRERTYTIGNASVWRTTDARDKARELRREIEDGGDPLLVIRRWSASTSSKRTSATLVCWPKCGSMCSCSR